MKFTAEPLLDVDTLTVARLRRLTAVVGRAELAQPAGKRTRGLVNPDRRRRCRGADDSGRPDETMIVQVFTEDTVVWQRRTSYAAGRRGAGIGQIIIVVL